MRLVCPSCAAVYEVPQASLRPGRRTRCARCGTMWVPVREEPPVPPLDASAPASGTDGIQPAVPAAGTRQAAAVPAAPAPGAGSALDRLAARAQHRSLAALRIAWAASFLLLAGSAAVAYVWRAEVVRAWPPSARVLGTAARNVHGPSHEPTHGPTDAPPPPASATRH